MATTVSLYKCSSDNRVIDKTLTSVKTGITCQFKEDNSITQPHVVIPYFDGYKDVNYFYIPSNGRYYYLSDTIQRIGNLLEFRGTTDVLMSFKSSILSTPAIVARSSSNGNVDLPDPDVKITNKYELRKPDSGDFVSLPGSQSYILTVVG